MKLLFLILILPVILASDVIKLTDANFDEEIKGMPLALVKFFAPWCGHCKKMAPAFEEAATTMVGKAALVEMDCTIHKEACSAHGVRGYPTLKVFKSGTASDYKGGRGMTDLVNAMTAEAAAMPAATEPEAEPEAEEVAEEVAASEPEAEAEEATKSAAVTGQVVSLTVDTFANTIANVDTALVKFFAPWCGHCKSMAQGYKDAAKELGDNGIKANLFEVDCTVEKDVCSKFGVRGYPTLKVFQNGKDEAYSGGRSKDQIVAGVTTAAGAASGSGRKDEL